MPLVPANLRLQEPEEPRAYDPANVVVQIADDGADLPDVGEDGKVLEIKHPDGSISVSMDGASLLGDQSGKPLSWFSNLVEKIDDGELNRISDDLMRGIQEDIDSRKEWIEDRANGIKLLGLKVEIPSLQGATDGAPVEGISRVRHPLLLEAVLRFQANARSELLPTDGPVKIRNDNNNSTMPQEQLADALERDMNHFLTVTASEYYPDTDRMLLMLGFGGSAFKKVYFCPLRNRPVSETVDAEDLIVNMSATDLRNAKRVTHRTFLKPTTVKRLQILGVYRDIDLFDAKQPELNSVDREKMSQQGLKQESMRPEDRDREIYECYCELDIKGFAHKYKGSESGLAVPYIVTIDASSTKILSIVRNYDEEQQDLPEARTNFVKYTFAPGFGFYDIGLLHILGNTTNAITAAWRELLDSGMFASFPGFLMADVGARQNTNIFRIPPGGGAVVKTGGMPINQAIMPVPYQGPNGALMSLVENVAQTGMRLGGTAETAVGEGRQDAPVGTTIALIEQAQKVLSAVHKRLHASQAEEFQLLKRTFKEHPESFWQANHKPAYQWDEQTFTMALNDIDLVPQADPNTASHMQRVMKVMALKQLQAAQPSLYDPVAVDTAALQAIGWSNPNQFFVPPTAQANPPPELIQAKADAQSKLMTAQARMMDAQTKAQETQAKMSSGGLAGGQPDPELHLKAIEAMTRAKQIDVQERTAAIENENRAKDRNADLVIEQAKIALQQMKHRNELEHERVLHQHDTETERLRNIVQMTMKREPKP